jgi:FkbM family methyltransferase
MFKLSSKKKKFLKKLGLHHPWRLFLKVSEIRYIPVYINLLGFVQYIKLIKTQNSDKKELLPLKVRNFEYPIYVRSGTSDLSSFKQIFIKEEFKNLKKIDRKIETIIDAGSNCGHVSIYLSKLFPNAKIIAIEPDTSNCSVIRKNIKHYKNIKLLKGGVWHSDSNLKIFNPDTKNWSFRVEEVKESEGDFKGYNLKTIMNKYNFKKIDILKMDIEGSEKNVFEKNYKYWLSKTKLGFVEVHERYARGVTKIINKRIKEYKFKTSQEGEKLFFYK